MTRTDARLRPDPRSGAQRVDPRLPTDPRTLPLDTRIRPAEPAAPAPPGGLGHAPLTGHGRLFSASVVGSSNLINVSETLTLNFASVRWRLATEWELFGVLVQFNGAGVGAYRLSDWRCGGLDLGHDVYGQRGVWLPLHAPIPGSWDSTISVLTRNNTGATSTLFLTAWIRPLSAGCAP